MLTLAERMTRRHGALVPPAHLRLYYYGTRDLAAFTRACDNARLEVVSRGLRSGQRILDIGSGIGNLALGLIDHVDVSYDGLEIHPEAVQWCRQTITPRHEAFRFHRANVSNNAYNPGGAVAPSAYRFPFEDNTFDFIFVGSVFTHLLPDSAERYVREIARVLARDGVCVASYFLLNDETRTGVDSGASFMTFSVRHSSGVCRLHDRDVPEAAVAFEETFVRKVHDEAGLAIRDVRRGAWWTGTTHDQDLLTVGLRQR